MNLNIHDILSSGSTDKCFPSNDKDSSNEVQSGKLTLFFSLISSLFNRNWEKESSKSCCTTISIQGQVSESNSCMAAALGKYLVQWKLYFHSGTVA